MEDEVLHEVSGSNGSRIPIFAITSVRVTHCFRPENRRNLSCSFDLSIKENCSKVGFDPGAKRERGNGDQRKHFLHKSICRRNGFYRDGRSSFFARELPFATNHESSLSSGNFYKRRLRYETYSIQFNYRHSLSNAFTMNRVINRVPCGCAFSFGS